MEEIIMTKMKNRLSFVLAVIMAVTFVLACLPMTASAAAADDVASLNSKKVFDLGLNFKKTYGTAVGSTIKDVSNPDNALYNQVSGGITLHKWYGTPGYDKDNDIEYFQIDTGDSVANQIGLSVIPFTTWKDGFTLETYVKLEYGDNKNTDKFQLMIDVRSNLNLLKLDYAFFGMNTGNDLMEETSVIPVNQWLHIVATQEDGHQAVFVNGTMVMSDEYDYDTSIETENQLWFGVKRDDEDNIIKFNDIRLYAGAISDEGAALMYNNYLNELEGDVLDDFTDVNKDGWYATAIRTVINKGLFAGVTDTTFAPDVAMSRAMFVTVLARLNNVDLTTYVPTTVKPFTDLTADQWFYNAVMWAYENELVDGMTPTTFDPDGKITREQMCVLFVRFAEAYDIELTATKPGVTFADESAIGSWAIDAVKTCQKAGLVDGMTPTTFVPTTGATRAQVATIFTRLLDKLA